MAVIEWKQVKPDFSSSNSSMQNAMSGLSKAGTVFGELRKAMQEKEQRDLENAYRQQVFDENVRQFEEQQAWNRENALAGREHDKYMADLRQEYELAQIAQRHKNEVAIKAGEIQRYTDALNLGTTTYNDRIKAGDTPVQALEAANTRVRNAGFGDLGINAINFVPMTDQNKVTGMLTPEWQATQGARQGIAAGTLALDAKGKEQTYNEYADIFSRLRSGDDGSQGIMDANTGELRPLTVEEQDYLNKVQNLQVADAMQVAPETIKAIRQEVEKRGYTVPDAEQLGYQILGGIGLENLYRDQSFMYGADPSKVIPTDVANKANEERTNMAAIEEAKRKAEADARTNSKTSTYNKHLYNLLDLKITDADGKVVTYAVNQKILDEAQSYLGKFVELNIGADQFEKYIKLLVNDIRFNETNYMSSNDAAKQFAENLIKGVPTTGTGSNGGTGGNGGTKSEPGNGLVGLGNSSQENKPAPEAMRNTPEDTSKMDDVILANALQSIKNFRSSHAAMFREDGTLVPGAVGFGGPDKALERAKQLKTKEENLTKVVNSLKANKPVDLSSEEAKTVKNNLLTLHNRYQRQRRATPENLQYLARIEQLLKLFEKGA